MPSSARCLPPEGPPRGLRIPALSLLIACGLATCGNDGEKAPVDATPIDAVSTAGWVSQLGGNDIDLGHGVAVDPNGNVYAVGETSSTELAGIEGSGASDGFVVKQRLDGKVAWTRLLGTAEPDTITGIAVDSAGNACITGSTGGELASTFCRGASDAFLARLTPDGNTEWISVISSLGEETSMAVAIDQQGSCYATGLTNGAVGDGTSAGQGDAFVAKYSAKGEPVWVHMLASESGDMGSAIALDAAGNVYVAGYTGGVLDGTSNAGSFDLFVAKYAPDGTQGWVWQFGGTGEEYPNGLVVDSQAGALYLTGYTLSSLDGKTSQGDKDAFLIKLGIDGTKQWTEQFGTSKKDTSFGIDLDAGGAIVICGRTEGTLAGEGNKGLIDYFVARYQANGERAWIVQDGSEAVDTCWDLAVGPGGRIHLVGYTNGVLGEQNAGAFDAFVRKLEQNVGNNG
ncbi:MAG: SBBP repeat-containing protein [Pseudomonadota bacterium]